LNAYLIELFELKQKNIGLKQKKRKRKKKKRKSCCVCGGARDSRCLGIQGWSALQGSRADISHLALSGHHE
jgi:hypothetical protein